jgi:hypothetical protein
MAVGRQPFADIGNPMRTRDAAWHTGNDHHAHTDRDLAASAGGDKGLAPTKRFKNN